jgi:hypothetical protein
MRQKNNFSVIHTTNLCFDFGNRVFANVPTGMGAPRSQHGLRPSLSVANFSHDRADNVLNDWFAHNFALTVCELGLVFLPISEGASFGDSEIIFEELAGNPSIL